MARVGHPGAGRASRTGRVLAALGAVAGLALSLSGCAGPDASRAAEASPAAALAAQAERAPDAAAAPGGTPSATSSSPTPTSPSRLGAAADDYSEVGDLVDGFPIDLLPVPSDSVILVTSAVPVGDADVQEVSLNLRTSAKAADLLDLYRRTLTSAGFVEVPPPADQTDLAAESTFTRSGGDELITIGVLDVDGARTVSVGGRLHTGS